MTRLNLPGALFSNVQQRVLALIFGHPDRSFYVSEIVKSLKSGTGGVERELSRLEQSGLVSVKRIGNQKHYQANRDSPIFEELRSIVLKTVGLAGPLRTSLAPYLDKIETAFVYGSIAARRDTAGSDVDVMVIGNDLAYADLYAVFQDTETILRREINPTFMSAEDWRRKVSDKDSIIAKIAAQPKLFIVGSETDL